MRFACVTLTEREAVVLDRIRQREQLSMANFVRRCINGYLLEEGDTALLLTELRQGHYRGGRPRRAIRCRAGHPYTAANTYVTPGRVRVCRTCRRGWDAAWRQRRRARRQRLLRRRIR